MNPETEKEFDEMTLEDGVPSENESLYDKGGVSEWLKQNSDKHLCSDEIYREPMCDLDSFKVKDWINKNFIDRRVLEEELDKITKRHSNPSALECARGHCRGTLQDLKERLLK